MVALKRLVVVATIAGIALLLVGRAAVGGGAVEDFSATGSVTPHVSAATTITKYAASPTTAAAAIPADQTSSANRESDGHGELSSQDVARPVLVPQSAQQAGAGGCGKWLQAMRSHFLSIHRFNRIKIAGVEPLAVSTVLPQLHTSMCDHGGEGGGASNVGQQQVVIDVGANDGEDIPHWFNFFGAESGAPCGAKTRFFLVEPQRKYQAGLKQLATGRANGGKDTVVLHGAVGRDEQHGSTAAIFGTGQQGRVNLEGAKAVVEGASNAAAKPPVNEGETPILSLRRVLLEHNVPATAPIVMLKVDCEGADATIITDSEPIFAAHRVGMLVFELNSRERFFKKRTVDAAKMLESHGYAMYAFGIEATTKDAVFVKANAAHIAKWRVKLETIVAFSPAMIARLGDTLKLGGPRALTKLPAIDANNACNEGAFTVPCPLCLKTTAAPVKVHL